MAFAKPGWLLALIVLLGGVLRFYRFDALSLWLDEGFTVYFSRLPWHMVLGLDGAYDVHPPLYYALVKAVSLVVREIDAGRLVSVVAGTATIPALYALAVRLAGPWIAVLASLVLAVSPLHIWYSQEGRQYALVVLLTCISYVALVAFSQSPGWGWALLYFGTLLLSIYVEYSAIYALLPQIVILAVIIRRQGRRAIPVIVAVVGAIVCFIPWIPQLVGISGTVSYQERFDPTPTRVGGSVLSIMGLAEPLRGQSEPGGVVPTTAAQTSTDLLVYGILLLLAIPAVVVGLVALARRSRLALLVALCLGAGTVASAIAVSFIYPSYAKRTVLTVVLGWALVVGAAALENGLPLAVRIVGRASVAVCLAVSLVVLGITYTSADKQHWRELAADVAAATRSAAPASDGLLITYPTITDTLLDVYQPHVLDGNHVRIDDGGSVPTLDASSKLPHTIWLAYIEVPGIEGLQAQLQAMGYSRVSHKEYPGTLYLDTFAHP